METVAFWQAVAIGLAATVIVQGISYAIAIRLGRVDSVDVGWGISFLAVIVALQLVRPTGQLAVLIVEGLVVIWGVRLATHIGRRFARSDKQDERYTALMRSWPPGDRRRQILYRIFLVQAGLATMVSLGVIAIHSAQLPISYLTIVGCGVWLAGFVIESVADQQLAAYIRSSLPGGLLQSGLWRYSRHPNYFGEVIMWWGIAVVGLATPVWWAGIVGAATITWLICFVSGIPPAEARASTRQGWNAYRRRTSVFVPWPPRRP